MALVIDSMEAVDNPLTDEEKNMLDTWYNSLPNCLRCCIYQWRERNYEQKMYVYLNPSQEFVSQSGIYYRDNPKK